ncbi:MAG: UbiA-like polyprenyltransferase [bacterium]|jgi:4-hydroxybenzoate polyprenyltransferase
MNTKVLERVSNYLGLVRFAHTIFALPFACMSALVAAEGLPSWRVCWWILFCMVSARTSAMTFNRIADRDIDRLNPRTQDRHIPTGKVRLSEAWGLWIVSSLLFIWGAWQLNSLAFLLSPLALLIVCAYSFFKRFSALAHFVLGLALGIAPVGAWIAVTGEWAAEPFVLTIGVLFWVAGFDIIYALMDEEFDRRMGLHSIVVRFGKKHALRIAFLSHRLSIIFIAIFGLMTSLSWLYLVGVIGFAGLIIYEHSLVRPDDLSRVNIAFFNVNGIISIGLFLFTILDILIPPMFQ